MALAPLSAGFQSLSPLPTIKLGPSGADSPSGWVCARSRPPWVSPTNSPVRLGVSPAASTPTGVFNQRFEALFPRTGALGCVVCHWVHQLPPCPPHSTICHLAGLARPRLAASPLHPGCLSLPLLPVWMNVSSLSPWLSDFHTVRFSVSSSCFLFLNCCCPSFGCVRRHSVSTYTSILAGSQNLACFWSVFTNFQTRVASLENLIPLREN